MRESPNGMASASQADSRGFDSRLSLQKREAFLGFSFLESCIRIEPQAHAKHGSTAAACPAPVGSGSKSLAPSRRKLPSPAPSHRRTHVTTYGNDMPRACRFGFEEPCALAAQTPVSCSFPQAHACYDLRQWHVLRLSVRARRALRPCGANSRLLLVRVQSDYKITLQTATGKLSDLYVKSAPAISRGAFLIDFFLVMRRWKSDRCNGLHTS